MIPAPYNTWPVVMSRAKAAQLLGIDRKTLAKNQAATGQMLRANRGQALK